MDGDDCGAAGVRSSELLRLRESKPTRVTATRDQRGTARARGTPDLREFQRYLLGRRAPSLSRVRSSPGRFRRAAAPPARNARQFHDGIRDAATSGFRGIRAYPPRRCWEERAAPPFSFTRVTLRDSLRPVSRPDRYRSIIATGRARQRRRPAVFLRVSLQLFITSARISALSREWGKWKKKKERVNRSAVTARAYAAPTKCPSRFSLFRFWRVYYFPSLIFVHVDAVNLE